MAECGAAGAKDKAACGKVVNNQVFKPIIFIGKIAAAAGGGKGKLGKSSSAGKRIKAGGKQALEDGGDIGEIMDAYDWPLCSEISAKWSRHP